MMLTPLEPWIGKRITPGLEKFDRRVIELHQLERLQWVVGYVRQKSPFYRDLFQGLPVELHTLADLQIFPFTRPEDIQADPNRFACVPQDDIRRVVTQPTSGTTGPSKRLFFSTADQELTIDFFKVGMSTLARAGDRVLIMLPGKRPGSVGDLLRIGLERLGCIAVPYGPLDEEQILLKTIRDQKINLIVGAPVQIHRLARWDERYAFLPKDQIRSLLISTDYLADTIRTNLERIWGCEVFDHYGMTETGLGGGVECVVHQGYHIREADLYIEIIDPQTGNNLREGDAGEVVLTTLTRDAMPLIRYRTRDFSRILTGTCQCGSFIKRLERIKYRFKSGIRLNSGMVYQADFDESLFQMDGLLDFLVTFEDENETIAKLKLELLLLDKGKNFSEESFVEALNKIPIIYQERKNGTLVLQISEMESHSIVSTGYMAKRMLFDNRKNRCRSESGICS